MGIQWKRVLPSGEAARSVTKAWLVSAVAALEVASASASFRRDILPSAVALSQKWNKTHRLRLIAMATDDTQQAPQLHNSTDDDR